MAKIQYPGAQAQVEVDVIGDGQTWNNIGCTISITPPPQEKEDIEATCQQDAVAQTVAGIEQVSRCQFEEPYDYEFTKAFLDDLYENDTDVTWRLTFVNQTNQQVIEFPGRVSSLVPQATGRSDVLRRVVTITRTGAIVHNPGA